MAYVAARSLDEAFAALGAEGAIVVAGGTDVFPAHAGKPAPSRILDITRIDEMRGIEASAAGWRIGGATRWSEIIAADLPPAFDGLKAAAREVGSIQIQNAGTIAGNLCNASPAADGAPPLLTLDAAVEIASANERRTVPLADFITGPRRTGLKPGELVTAILAPPQPTGARSAFLKLGARKHLVISIAMTAVLIWPDAAGRVGGARVSVGACGPVARRLGELEAALRGRAFSDLAEPGLIAPGHLAPLAPINDIRGGAGYRLDAAATLIRRALLEAAGARHG
ncbi:xanthine dehydrogenase family protein subunit M [Pikeienuella piscinae]|uniref:Xanthine dehydrogenase family protein subunit M n=1 Tax=Pikeienuella piscinae TaxID=2748098 RepID=A0A7L5BWJ7_9RHOB|nr:FAD binding domain-containing protein [Pikeienuella piscinae]QIE56092.1 xanthine dehydrogenase family protein subunit M [Pikeienuella piscinae]